MRNLIHYLSIRLGAQKRLLWVLFGGSVLFFAMVYAIGLVGQPKLVSYVEDGMFYGTYQFEMDIIRLVCTVAALCVVFFMTSNAFAGYFDPRRSTLNLMLPCGVDIKFFYALLFNYIIVPVVILGLLMLNDLVWSHFLQIDTAWGEARSGHCIVALLTFLAINSVFFYFGILFRRFQWAWALALVGGVTAAGYIYFTLTTDNIKNEIEFSEFSPLIVASIELLIIVMAIVLADRRFKKIEQKG